MLFCFFTLNLADKGRMANNIQANMTRNYPRIIHHKRLNLRPRTIALRGTALQGNKSTHSPFHATQFLHCVLMHAMMKQLFLTTLFMGVVGWYSHLNAQYYEHAVALKAGSTFGFSYKKFHNRFQAVEGTFGVWFQKGWVVSGTFQHHFEIGFNKNFTVWGGGGGMIGVFTYTPQPTFGAALLGSIGTEYTFPLSPICVALEYQPSFGTTGLTYNTGVFAARYTFQ